MHSQKSTHSPDATQTDAETIERPWAALWSLIVGFFMILIDTTIVSVANPSIEKHLHTSINSVIWVTSAYLLAYAVPLLVTGRLGDRYGPKNVYLAGLVLFTAASAWCGLSGTIGLLIAARVVQGLGASLMMPQTMSVIARVFPAERRGAAMGAWGAVAGLALLVGPVLGGVLVGHLGWEWIFYINVPVGLVGIALTVRLVPRLRTHNRRFDVVGVLLSGLGLFLIVFGLQEGEPHHWSTIAGPVSVWSAIVVGALLLVAFVGWEGYTRAEPLMPLSLFRDRNFSLSSIAIAAVSGAITSMGLPLFFYFQIVRGMSPTKSGLMLVPMAAVGLALASTVGSLLDRINSRAIVVTGALFLAGAGVLFAAVMTPHASIWLLLVPAALLGVANACLWAPISKTAMHDLAPEHAGAGSGFFNTAQQVGGVLASAAISALISSRLAANLPTGGGQSADAVTSGQLPLTASVRHGFATAMGQSILLPVGAGLLALVVAVFFRRSAPQRGEAAVRADDAAVPGA